MGCLTAFGLTALVVGLIALPVKPWPWVLVSYLGWFAVWGALFWVLFFALLREWRWTLGALLACLIATLPMTSYLPNVKVPSLSGKDLLASVQKAPEQLRLYCKNLSQTRDTDPVLEQLLQHKPHVAVLEAVPDALAADFLRDPSIKAVYPYQWESPSKTIYLSQTRLLKKRVRALHFPLSENRFLFYTLVTLEHPRLPDMTLVQATLPSPLSDIGYQQQQTFFKTVLPQIQRLGTPTLIVGTLNLPPQGPPWARPPVWQGNHWKDARHESQQWLSTWNPFPWASAEALGLPLSTTLASARHWRHQELSTEGSTPDAFKGVFSTWESTLPPKLHGLNLPN
jgi:hypothetical protein